MNNSKQLQSSSATFIFNCDAWLMTINNKNIKIIGTFEKPWISGKELCEALGYKDTKMALFNNVKQKHKTSLKKLFEEQKMVDPEFTTFFWPFTNGFTYNEGKAVYISERGAYHLAMKCELSIGDAFRDWLAEDVIASIRQTGRQYKLQQQLSEAMEKLVIEKQKLNEFVSAEQIQKIYISTCVNYAKQNKFKVGGVESKKQLKSRLAVYNTRSFRR